MLSEIRTNLAFEQTRMSKIRTSEIRTIDRSDFGRWLYLTSCSISSMYVVCRPLNRDLSASSQCHDYKLQCVLTNTNASHRDTIFGKLELLEFQRESNPSLESNVLPVNYDASIKFILVCIKNIHFWNWLFVLNSLYTFLTAKSKADWQLFTSLYRDFLGCHYSLFTHNPFYETLMAD